MEKANLYRRNRRWIVSGEGESTDLRDNKSKKFVIRKEKLVNLKAHDTTILERAPTVTFEISSFFSFFLLFFFINQDKRSICVKPLLNYS